MLLIESIYPLLLRRVSSFSPIRPYPLQNHSIFTFPSRYLFSTRPDNGRQLKDRNFQQYSRASPIYLSTTVFVSTCGSVFDVCAISCFFGRAVPPPISADLPIGQFPLPLSHKHPFHSGTLYFTPRVSRHPCQRALLTAYYHLTFNLSLANQVAILVAVTTNNRILLFVHSLTVTLAWQQRGVRELYTVGEKGELDRKFYRHLFLIAEKERNTICFGNPRDTKELQSNKFNYPNNMRNVENLKFY